MMRILLILIITIVSNSANAQQIEQNSISVFIDGRNAPDPEGICGRYNGICLVENAALESTEELIVGKFYLDSIDSLKLGFNKAELPLDIILHLFQNNTFYLDNPINLPKSIYTHLDIPEQNSIIDSGQYSVIDNQRTSMIVINFGFIDKGYNSQEKIAIDKIDSKTEKIREKRTLNKN